MGDLYFLPHSLIFPIEHPLLFIYNSRRYGQPSHNRPALKSLKWRRTVRKTGHLGQFSTPSYIISGFPMQDALAQADQQKLLPAIPSLPIMIRLYYPKRHKNYSTGNDKRTKTAGLSRFPYLLNNQPLILKCSTLGKRCVCLKA